MRVLNSEEWMIPRNESNYDQNYSSSSDSTNQDSIQPIHTKMQVFYSSDDEHHAFAKTSSHSSPDHDEFETSFYSTQHSPHATESAAVATTVQPCESVDEKVKLHPLKTVGGTQGNDDDRYLPYSDVKLLSFLVFCINYGFSIEMVFISPFFFKVETPDILDTVIWLLPPLVCKGLFPIISASLLKQTPQILRHRKLFLLFAIALSIIGKLFMAYPRYITENWIRIASNRKRSILGFGIFGFIFQDVGHDIINNFMANMTFAYSLGAILLFVSLILTFKGLRTNSMRITMYQERQPIEIQNYSLDSIFPRISNLKNMMIVEKYLMASHFLMCGNLLLINIYATLWIGQSLEESEIEYSVVDSDRIRDYWFDIGISWGALILAFAAVAYYLSFRVVEHLKKNIQYQKYFLFVSNLLLNVSFIYTYFTNSFIAAGISLLLWGIAQQTFETIPQRLCSHIRMVNDISRAASTDFLDFSMFCCQIVFWFVMPAIFLLGIDDISFSLLQGSILGVIGSFFVLLVN